MTPEQYDRWYASGRGQWIGETELSLLVSELDWQTGGSILDVGCGTGWFTRRVATLPQHPSVTGIDIDIDALAYAKTQDSLSHYLSGDARDLPFADASFDCVVSVAALCFVQEWPEALKEIIRVTRHRFVIGLLNRHSLLWRKKGRGNDQSAYKGAHWHTRGEIRDALASLPIRNIRFHTAIWLPGGGPVAQRIEAQLPNRFPFGGFLMIVGDRA